jgi:LPPG:FO 2-phospho-L-lactate transferase
MAIEEVEVALLRNREKVIVVSPIVGDAAVSGPAGELMRGIGYKVSPLGVARIYREIASAMIIDRRDGRMAGRIEEFGIRVVLADLLMPDLPSRVRLAREVLSLAGVYRGAVSNRA